MAGKNLPHPKVLETLAQMKADGLLDPANLKAAREVLQEHVPDAVKPKLDAHEQLVQDLMRYKGWSREKAEAELELYGA